MQKGCINIPHQIYSGQASASLSYRVQNYEGSINIDIIDTIKEHTVQKNRTDEGR